MKKVYLFAFLVAMVSSGYSQKENLQFTSFNTIDAFGPFDIELIKSDTEYIEVDYKGIEKENVVLEQQRGAVRLKFKNRHYFDEWNNHTYRKSDYLKVKVYYKDIDVIEAKAGAVVTSPELLKSKYLRIESSMGAEVKLDILAKDIDTKVNMGGILELTGTCERQDATASMGGVLRASRLESRIVSVKATMGAEVKVNVLEELEVSSAFGASVDYIGGPAVRHTSKSMGGEVNGRGN